MCDFHIHIYIVMYVYMHIQEGGTPLMAAIQEGHLEAARVLVMECNCNTNAKTLVSYSVNLTAWTQHVLATGVCVPVHSLLFHFICTR